MRFSKAIYPGAVVLAMLLGATGGVIRHVIQQPDRPARGLRAFPVAANAVVFEEVEPIASIENAVMRIDPEPQPVVLPPAEAIASLKADYRFSGPYAHENLTLFLVHGEDQLDTSRLLTLEEAMGRPGFNVRDLHSHNLALENRSGSESVVVFAGDVLEGGYQDRVARYDVIAAAGSGRVTVPAFCVEKTRSSGPEGNFRSNPDQLASHRLRLASRLQADQAEVWNAVNQLQTSLAANTGVATVRSPQSQAQLTYSLQHQAVRDAAERYTRGLESIGTDESDVIGYVLAVNGRIRAVDVYGSSGLFRKGLPKLLRAAAIEAVAERGRPTADSDLGTEEVRHFVASIEGGRATRRDFVNSGRLTTQESVHAVLFETRQASAEGAWIRRNYLAKSDVVR